MKMELGEYGMNTYLLRLVACLCVFNSLNSFGLTCADLDGARVEGQDFNRTYLGFFGSSAADESIMNFVGDYGSILGQNSVRSSIYQFGSFSGLYSANNPYTYFPPKVFKGASHIAYLTTNDDLPSAVPLVSLTTIDTVCGFTALNPASITNTPANFFDAQYTGSLTVGSNLTVSIQISDPDGFSSNINSFGQYNILAYDQAGNNISTTESAWPTGQLLLTESLAGADLTFFFIFMDDMGNIETSPTYFIGTVASINQPPVFLSTPITPAAEDASYSYTVVVSDPDGDNLTLARNIPAWLSYDAATQTLLGVPQNSDVGNHAVSLTVEDTSGLQTIQSFTISVTNTNDAPVITSTPPLQVMEGEEYNYLPVFSDPDANDTATISVITLPSWISIDANSGALLGTPSFTDIGDHSVEIQAIDLAGASDSQSFTITVANDPATSNISDFNVPAMGGIGLLALGLSMLGLGAVRLRKE